MTLLLQNATALLLATAATLMVCVARAVPASGGRHFEGWHVSATAFVAFAIARVAQSGWGTWAYLEGPTSSVYSAYLRAAPLFNHAGSLLMLALYAGLAVLSFASGYGRAERRRFLLLVLALVSAGALGGLLEGPIASTRHFQVTAILNVVNVVVLGVLLPLLLVRDTVDRYLWAVLVTFWVGLSLSVVVQAALSLDGTGESWMPPAWVMQTVHLAVMILVTALVERRRRLARARIPVEGILPRSPRRTRTFAA